MLARLRFPVAQSRGRRYPEPAHPYRNEFQRDRDRVVHSRAFRRLEAKTQVFTPGLSDHFRNRLTHTIEVAQIARTLAHALELDEDLTEALALAHDIGHPPFAHAGEEALDRQMARFGERFDHNLHALRIVESFEQRYARFPGLNLTFEVREGIVKHSRDYAPGERPELDDYLPGLPSAAGGATDRSGRRGRLQHGGPGRRLLGGDALGRGRGGVRAAISGHSRGGRDAISRGHRARAFPRELCGSWSMRWFPG